jgi:hypothetical protein
MGGVVRGDKIDYPIEEGLPKYGQIFWRAKGGIHLG